MKKMTNRYINGLVFIALLLAAKPSFSALITEIPLNSITAEIHSIIPSGMNISIETFPNDIIPAVPIFQPLGDIGIFVSGQYIGGPTDINFSLIFDFGAGVGPVTVNDSFRLDESGLIPDGGFFEYHGAGAFTAFDFGLTGQALIFNSGTIDVFQHFPNSGDQFMVPYTLEIQSVDTVPLPASLWLMVSGIMGFAMVMRKRKTSVF